MRITVLVATLVAATMGLAGIGQAVAAAKSATPATQSSSAAASSVQPSSAQSSSAAAPGAAPTGGESVPSSLGNSTLDGIRKAFESRFPGVKVAGVRPTPFNGLYEVQIGTDVVYTDAHVAYVLQGSLVDAKTRTDLTAERLAKLSEVPFSSLPLKLAIVQTRGNGQRKIAVFEDPHCPYCKMLDRTLRQVDNITIYTFLYPILTPDSIVKARDIWCAKDRARAWSDWMIDGKAPAEASCDTPVNEVLALGHKLMVQGTPTIIFADGSRVTGALPLDQLNEKLAASH